MGAVRSGWPDASYNYCSWTHPEKLSSKDLLKVSCQLFPFFPISYFLISSPGWPAFALHCLFFDSSWIKESFVVVTLPALLHHPLFSFTYLVSLPLYLGKTSKMHSGLKNEVSASNFEITSTDNHSKSRIYAKLDNARIAVTSLALVAAIVILGVSAHSLAVYEQTHLPSDFLLPLWPKEFDIRPTNALIAGGVIVLVVNAVSLLTSKSQSVRIPQCKQE